MIREYMELNETLWSWDNIFSTLADVLHEDGHKLKFLEPKVDFFKRHPSQFKAD